MREAQGLIDHAATLPWDGSIKHNPTIVDNPTISDNPTIFFTNPIFADNPIILGVYLRFSNKLPPHERHREERFLLVPKVWFGVRHGRHLALHATD